VVIGDSDGAEAALLIASYEPHLADAIVANSPSYLITGAGAGPPGSAAWTLDGKPLTTGALVPVADIRVPVLLSDGGQDLAAVFLAAHCPTRGHRPNGGPPGRRCDLLRGPLTR
jgi:hypothetical protein